MKLKSVGNAYGDLPISCDTSRGGYVRCFEALPKMMAELAASKAAVAASVGQLLEAERRLDGAIAIFRRYGLRWEEDETSCGRAAGQIHSDERGPPRQALAKFVAALEIYGGLAAGGQCIEGVDSDKDRFLEEPDAPPRHPERLLTRRQMEVLRLITEGKSNREIAIRLVLSDRTIQRHIADIYRKIGAHNRVEATTFLLNGLSQDI